MDIYSKNSSKTTFQVIKIKYRGSIKNNKNVIRVRSISDTF